MQNEKRNRKEVFNLFFFEPKTTERAINSAMIMAERKASQSAVLFAGTAKSANALLLTKVTKVNG